MAKYIGMVNIQNMDDVEKLKRTGLLEDDVPEEILNNLPGTWALFDIEYLELFWASETRRKIIDEGLALGIKRNLKPEISMNGGC